MALLTPYAIDGAQHPAALFRRQLQYALGDKSGVAGPTDFKVTPLDTPGGGVKIHAGGVLIQSRAGEMQRRETYGVENDAVIEWFGGDGASGIPGTGSGETRRDMIIVEVLDPEMPGVTEPSDPLTAEYARFRVIPGVPTTVKQLDDLTDPEYANVTGYCIGIINWPASTATITAGMLEDPREIPSALPAAQDSLFETFNITATDYLVAADAYPNGQTFPNRVFETFIPADAVAANCRFDLTNIAVPSGSPANGTFWGELSAGSGLVRTPQGAFNADSTANAYRETWTHGGQIAIPASMRGKPAFFRVKARLASAVTAPQRVALTSRSAALIDLRFIRAAD